MLVNYLWDNFCAYWHRDAERAISYKVVNGSELEVKLNDGTALVYSDLDHSVRTILKNEADMTDYELNREFGLRLQSLLVDRCMSQVELSELTGIQQNAISRYIHGKLCPTYPTLVKMARALNCSLDDFRYL